MTKFIDNFLKNRAERKRVKNLKREMRDDFAKIQFFKRKRLIHALHGAGHHLDFSLYEDWNWCVDFELERMVSSLISPAALEAIKQQIEIEQRQVREKYKEIVI